MGVSANTRPEQRLLFFPILAFSRVPILVSEPGRVEELALRGNCLFASAADWNLLRLALSMICGSAFSILRGYIRTDRSGDRVTIPINPDWLGNATRKTLSHASEENSRSYAMARRTRDSILSQA